MKQYDAVIQALENLGGQATQAELYIETMKIGNCKWGISFDSTRSEKIPNFYSHEIILKKVTISQSTHPIIWILFPN